MERNEGITTKEGAVVQATAERHDDLRWLCHTTVKKFNGDSTDEKDCYETLEIPGNLVVIGGSSALWHRLTGGTAVVAFDNANAALGVGDGTTAADDADIDLNGVNKARKPMDPSYPQHTDSATSAGAQTLTFRSTFLTSEANFAWDEWGIFNSVTLGTGRMLNHKVESLGVKAAGSTWQLTVTTTIASVAP